MLEINLNLKNTEPYQMVSQDFWRSSRKIIKADWNEEFFRNEQVEAEMVKFIQSGLYNVYPDVEAYDLRKALSGFHGVPIENISVFNGSDEALDVICRTFLNKGDKVVVRNPEYSNFYVFVQSSGAMLMKHYQDEPFVVEESKLHDFIRNEKPKIFYTSNPNNPTGYLYDANFLLELVEEFTDTLFIIDEAYIHFAFDQREAMDKLLVQSVNHNNLVVTRTFSKLFSLAGLRVGYVVSSRSNIEYLSVLKKPKNVSMISQVAARTAIENWGFYDMKKREVVQAREEFIISVRNLKNVEMVANSKGNFVSIRFGKRVNVNSLIENLRNKGLYVRNRSNIDQLENVIRITLLDPFTMHEVTEIIKDCLESFS